VESTEAEQGLAARLGRIKTVTSSLNGLVNTPPTEGIPHAFKISTLFEADGTISVSRGALSGLEHCHF
jgi:hypothetical protein